MEFRVSGPAFVKSVSSFAKFFQCFAQFHESRATGEEKLAKIALAPQDLFAAGFQRIVVEREHRPVGFAGHPAECVGEHAFGQSPAGIVEKVSPPFADANEAARFTVDLEIGFHFHRVVAVQEGVAAAVFEREQQVEKPGQRSGFSRFVRAVDHMQVGRALRCGAEVDLVTVEKAVPQRAQAAQAHQSAPRAALS